MADDEQEPGGEVVELVGAADEQARAILAFWEAARPSAGVGKVSVVVGAGVPESVPPPAWSFGDNPELADSLLAAVMSGARSLIRQSTKVRGTAPMRSA